MAMSWTSVFHKYILSFFLFFFFFALFPLIIFFTEIDIAKACGETMLKFIDNQPDFDNKLYLRMSAKTGQIITTIPQGMEPFYVVKKDAEKQLYFFLGYHGIFMMKLFQVTKDTR